MLINSFTKEHLDRFLGEPHQSLALTGPDGAGKGYLAHYIAGNMLDIEIDKVPLNPYFKTFDAATEKNGIDMVRDIQSFLSLKVPGHNAIKRIVAIEHVDSLRHEAQNALLKTLEEPPQDTVIIITFSVPNLVLPTIHSRVLRINVQPVDLEQTETYFSGHLDTGAIKKYYFMSGGYPGVLAALIESSEDHPLVIAINEAKQLIGASRYERIARVDSLVKSKALTPKQVVDGMYRLLEASYKLSVDTKERKQLEPLAKKLAHLERAYQDLSDNTQAKLVLSRLFFEL